MAESPFSTTYQEARHRFLAAAKTAGADVHSYPIDAPSPGQLAIDVAVLGVNKTPAVVISSGVHGVEGFFGSAIQLALFEQRSQATSETNIRYVLIHAVNPFGFSRLRRFNEDNIDLNRNFLSSADRYRGAPEGYAALNRFLNPESPPSRFEPFKLRALWSIWRHGLRAITASVSGGQYDYPRGLFFGGYGLCNSAQLIQQHCDDWLASSRGIVHIDFHSGLGSFGTYELMLPDSSVFDNYSWYVDTFGADCVEPRTESAGDAYTGLFGGWMQDHFSSHDYHSVVAEFGTYSLTRVLGAIRAENRAHHYGCEDSANYQSAKRELLECFCPTDPSWRQQVVESGLKIIAQATKAVS